MNVTRGTFKLPRVACAVLAAAAYSRPALAGPPHEFYYHAEERHSAAALSDVSGAVAERYEYADFGVVAIFDAGNSPLAATAVGNALLFQGRRWDPETALYQFRTRYLEATTGRFTARDTIGIWGDAAGAGNALAFASNNPNTHSDPTGRKKEKCAKSGSWIYWAKSGKKDTNFGGAARVIEKAKGQMVKQIRDWLKSKDAWDECGKFDPDNDCMLNWPEKPRGMSDVDYRVLVRKLCLPEVRSCDAVVGYNPNGSWVGDGMDYEWAMECKFGCETQIWVAGAPPPNVGLDLIKLATPGGAIKKGLEAIFTVAKWVSYVVN